MSVRYSVWFTKTCVKKKLNLRQAAERLQVQEPTIHRWQKGARPRSEHLARIVRWSGIDPWKLLCMLED